MATLGIFLMASYRRIFKCADSLIILAYSVLSIAHAWTSQSDLRTRWLGFLRRGFIVQTQERLFTSLPPVR